MAQRTRYRLADGSESSDRSDAQLVDASEIARMATSYTSVIPPGFFVGTAERETARATNEHDTDLNDDGSDKRNTFGLYQLGTDEQQEAGFDADEAQLYDPEVSSQVFAKVCEARVAQLRQAAADAQAAGLPVVDADVWAFLVMGHTSNMAAALKSIRAYGMDWNAFVLRNADGNDYVASKLPAYAGHVLDQVAAYAQADATSIGGDSSTGGGLDGGGLVAVLIVGGLVLLGKLG